MAIVAVSGPAGLTSDISNLLAGRDTRWYKGYLLKLNLILMLILITSATNGYDGSMMNGLQAVPAWRHYFGNPQEKPTLFGVFNAIQNIGSIAGLPFAPFVADKFGRRASIFLGAVIMIIATAIQTSSQNVAMFIASRGMIGFGLSFASLASPVLITELAFPTHRGPVTSLYNSSWYLGSIIAAWTTYGTFRMAGTWSWRIPSLLQGLPSILQVCLIWFVVPESPRWLVSKGRHEEARKIIAKYHCGGDEDDPLVEFEYQEIKEVIRLEQEVSETSSWKELVATPGNRRRMRVIVAISFFSQWSGNGLVSYYLTLILNGIGITDPGKQTLINGILQIYNYFWAIFGALSVDKVGRRPLWLTSTAGMCICFTIWTICSATYTKSGTEFAAECIAKFPETFKTKCAPLNANKSAGNAVIAFIFLFYGFYDIAMSPLLVSYTVEILPYRIRSKGLMVKMISVSASLVFNQYVNPIALHAIGWKYYIVFCVFLAFEFVFCYFFILETRGPKGALPLEEISLLFDGPKRYGFQKRREESVLDTEHYADPVDLKKGDELVEDVPHLSR